VRPVKTVTIEAPEIGFIRTLPGRIGAVRRAELSFRVPGKVAELPFVEGQEVDQGAVIARLDPADYRIAFNDRKATYDRAKADYDRGQQLVEQGTISRRDFDALLASFKSAEAALQAAEKDLEYTNLTAPFPGVIARRYVDNFEEVQAREPVLVLNDISRLEVKVDIPEVMMQRVRRIEPGGPRPRLYATFDNEPGRHFRLEFKEIATRADPKTQTFEVTMTMEPPEGLTVLSGMTTSVIVDTRNLKSAAVADTTYLVPASAVTGNLDLAPVVWIVDKGMTVQPRPVSVDEMVGDQIRVKEGLEPGDRVVVAGAAYLAPGMVVRLMPKTEQPANSPR
jgi:RND family efflux transporter MFP subunit